MNDKFKNLQYPDLDELSKRIQDNPACAMLLSLEYVLNCMIIDEFNKIREEASHLATCQRKDYELKGQHKRKFKLSIGEIELTVPRFVNHDFNPEAIEVAQKLHKIYSQQIEQTYISGASDRDISLDSQIDSGLVSRTTVSRYFQKEMIPEVTAFLTRDFESEDYIDLQVDAMYTKVLEPAPVHQKYENQAQIRVLGLSKNKLRWESLSLPVMPSESIISYQLAFEDLINRHIGTIYVVTTDFHRSFRTAITSTLIGVETQGCRFHHQKDISQRVKKDSRSQIKDLFTEIYDRTYSIEEALSAFERLSSEYDLNDELIRRFNSRFYSTLTYKVFPEGLNKEISTTNMAERCNEEERRRLDPRHLSPNDLSLLRLSISIAEREQESWFHKDVITVHEAYLSELIHKDHLDLLYNTVQKSISAYPQFFSDSLKGLEFIALWANLFVLPVVLNNRVMTIGFIALFGVNEDKSTKLLALSALESYDEEEIKENLERLKTRGLDTSKIKLIIQNTNIDIFISALENSFESIPIQTDSDMVLRRVLYLTPEDFKKDISKRFSKIFEQTSFREALTTLDELLDYLVKQHLFKPLALLIASDSSRLLNGFILVDRSIWHSLNIEDFKLRNSWRNKMKDLRNNPLDSDQTIKELVQVLKRKPYTKFPS